MPILNLKYGSIFKMPRIKRLDSSERDTAEPVFTRNYRFLVKTSGTEKIKDFEKIIKNKFYTKSGSN